MRYSEGVKSQTRTYGSDEIWKDFHSELRHFIRKRVADPSAAEDILQDVFIKIHSRIETLQESTKLRSWVYRITRNTIIDHYRKGKKSVELPGSLPEPESLPEGNAVIEEITPCVHSLMNSLPHHYREALVLTEYQDLTQKELGEKLGLSLPAAKARVQRGRQLLRGLLLDCCHLEFDRRGKVIDYRPKGECCKCKGQGG
jgi:RNA polymerase sigma-70 factor (ECF subfamily)